MRAAHAYIATLTRAVVEPSPHIKFGQAFVRAARAYMVQTLKHSDNGSPQKIWSSFLKLVVEDNKAPKAFHLPTYFYHTA